MIAVGMVPAGMTAADTTAVSRGELSAAISPRFAFCLAGGSWTFAGECEEWPRTGRLGGWPPRTSPFLSASCRIPKRYARPSQRQYVATPENSSFCHLTLRVDPTGIGVVSRRHVPEGTLDSILAGAW